MEIKKYRNLSIEVYDNQGVFMRFTDQNKPDINWDDFNQVEKFATELERSGDYNEVYIVSSGPITNLANNPGRKLLRRWNKRYGNY